MRQARERYAVKVNQELHKEVKERYNALGLRPYGGFINPEIVPVFAEVPESKVSEPAVAEHSRSIEGPTIIDYRVDYPSDFLAQHLEYGKKYSFLKPE